MLPTSAEVEPATSWSPVGRRIQLSHRGRLTIIDKEDNQFDFMFAFMYVNPVLKRICSKKKEFAPARGTYSFLLD